MGLNCQILDKTSTPAGLYQGLKSLADGGIPPRLLIIDDGWQCTDVDANLRQTTSQRLRLAESMPELDETEGEFIEAELEMLQMSARYIPAGSNLGEDSHAEASFVQFLWQEALELRVSFLPCLVDILHVQAPASVPFQLACLNSLSKLSGRWTKEQRLHKSSSHFALHSQGP